MNTANYLKDGACQDHEHFEEVHELVAFNINPLKDDDGDIYGVEGSVYVSATSGEHLFTFHETDYHRHIECKNEFPEWGLEDVIWDVLGGEGEADRVREGGTYNWSEDHMYLVLKWICKKNFYQLNDQYKIMPSNNNTLANESALGLRVVDCMTDKSIQIDTCSQLLDFLQTPHVEFQRKLLCSVVCDQDVDCQERKAKKRRM